MPPDFPLLLPLPPNRVRRNYTGGRGLDELEGVGSPADGQRPEDWVASLVEAVNPGLPQREAEGLARVEHDGTVTTLRELIAAAPDHYLGSEHVARWGTQTGFLAKLLDSAMRLHIQAHPTREFAREHYGKPWGKFETYVILATRPEVEPYILLGFQHPPTADEWLRIVIEQDKDAMLACFEKVPVAPGEVWYVPGGLPHALGEGLTVLEVMEPSDLVVRCEFERDGIVVPPPARFMGRDPAEALRIFDYTAWPVDRLRATFRVAPTEITDEATHSVGLREWQLIGPNQIDCFEVHKLVITERATLTLDGRFRIGIPHRGTGTVTAHANGSTSPAVPLRPGSCFFAPAAAHELTFQPNCPTPLELYACLPGTG